MYLTHNLSCSSFVKIPEAKSRNYIVFGSGLFIAIDGLSATTRIGTDGESSASMLLSA